MAVADGRNFMQSKRLIRRLAIVGALSAVALATAGSTVPAAAGTAAAQSNADGLSTPGGTPIYQDRSYSFAERAADLVARMTLAQKASQMNSSFSPAIPSLGVPQWGWWNEALHGVAREQLLNNAN